MAVTKNSVGILRLVSQHVDNTRFTTVKELVSWMGAMQAQDFASARWAIGVRLPGIKEDHVNDAINNGEIIRTHLMRPTWHLVTAEDYPLILQLTAPAIKTSLKSRRKQLELDNPFFKKTNPALRRFLSNNNHLTREELMQLLSAEIKDIDSSRMNHILLEAELDGLICSGKVKKGQHSFALATERLTDSGSIYNSGFNREEAMSMLAGKYFKSHGPATVADFNWWSGLSMTDCRKALESVRHELVEEEIDGKKYWLKAISGEAGSGINTKNSNALSHDNELKLLPAFDEFIISYRDRSAVMTFEDHTKAVSNNGVFRPVIVYDGQVIGIWAKTIKKGKLIVTPKWFISPGSKTEKMFKEAGEKYAAFLGVTIA